MTHYSKGSSNVIMSGGSSGNNGMSPPDIPTKLATCTCPPGATGPVGPPGPPGSIPEPKATILKSEFVEPTASPDQFDGYDDHPRNVLAAHARAEVTHANVDDTTGYVDDYTYENYSGDYYSSLTDDEDHIQHNK